MSRSAPSEARAFALGLAGIAAVTLWRVALLPFDTRDLFVDEAQYWFWGQDLAWGYYSKPPLIGWLMRAATEVGSDAAVWIRLPLPLIHGLTALVVAVIGRGLFGGRVGALAGFGFATLPAVALGSLLVSTDTPMLLAFALAMLAYLRLTARASLGWAMVLGAAIGVGLLAKYAMIYFPVCAVLALLLQPTARIAWRDAGLAAALALVIFAPNLVWNAANDFATLQHTADNADWQGPSLDLPGLLGFWAGQFAVAGPLLFAAYLAGLARLRSEPRFRLLATLSLPVFAIVSVQALVSGANANWAAAGHLGAVVIGAAVLAGQPRLRAASLAINLAVTLVLPVAVIFADSWRIGPNLVLARYVGQAEISRRAGEAARAEGLTVIVSSSRTLLADLFYTLRDADLAIFAAPAPGFPPHHFAQARPLAPGGGDVLYLDRGHEGPDCVSPEVAPAEVAHWRPELGYYTDEISAWRVARSCWYLDADPPRR